MRKISLALAATMAMTIAGAAPAAGPLVIAHRGASGLRPEHTLASYKLAIEEGADFIESDVVMTRDHVLVTRHENEISGTTDVADHPEFAQRRRTVTVDGQELTGWFTEDFTLAELKALRARERLGDLRPANRQYDGQFAVPTLQEVLDLIRAEEKRTKRRIGFYVETKHPTYHRSVGLPLEKELVAVLARNGYTRDSDPVFIESFEVDNLRELHKLTRIRLVQLMEATGHPADQTTSYAEMATPLGFARIASYAAGVGPDKTMILPRDDAGRSTAPTAFVANAHRVGLVVHPWTFRNENAFLPAEMRKGTIAAEHGDFATEYRTFRTIGVDGVFSDFPADAIAAFQEKAEKPDQPAN